MKRDEDIIANELNEGNVEVINDKFNKVAYEAADQAISKIPNIIDTINDIAKMNAETDKQVRLIEARAKKILVEADAYAKKVRAERDKIKAQGEVIINTLDKVNEALMSSRMPKEAKTAYAENLHKWIPAIVERED